MTLNVNEASILNKKNIKFTSTPQQEVKKQKSEEPKEEKSFYERNKKVLIALSAIGAAAIALGTHHYIKSRNITDAAESTTDKMTKKSLKAFNEFKEKLNKLSENDDATNIIKTALADDNPALKLKIIDLLLQKNGKHINGNNWENIFNSLVNIKTTENIKPEKISSKVNELYNILLDKNIVNNYVIDKIIEKLPEASDNVKLSLAQKLIDKIYKKGEYIDNDLNFEEIRKILSILDNVKQENFDYYVDKYLTYKDYNTSGLKYHYNKKLYTETEIDNTYITDLKNILNSNSLSDNDKLQLTDDIYYSKFIEKGNHTKEDIVLIKEILKSFEKNKADIYHPSNQPFLHKHDKFSLEARLFGHAYTYDNFNVFTTEEKLKIAQSLKEASKKVKVNTASLDGNAHLINDIYTKELDLRSKNFFEKLTPEISINDFDKFIDEMLAGYTEAKAHFIKGDEIFEKLDEGLLKQKFTIFQLDAYLELMKRQAESLLNFDTQGSKQIDEIFEKIENFGKKHFNTSENNYYRKSGKTNSNESKYNFKDFVNNKTQEAKSKLLDFLKKDDALKEFAEIVENNKLDKNSLKNIKRKFAIKYHPDKAKDDNQRAEFTRIFQEINDSIEILEKTL